MGLSSVSAFSPSTSSRDPTVSSRTAATSRTFPRRNSGITFQSSPNSKSSPSSACSSHTARSQERFLTTPSQEESQDTTLLLLASAQSSFSTFTIHLTSSRRMMRSQRNVDSTSSLTTAVLPSLASSTCSLLPRALALHLLMLSRASRSTPATSWFLSRASSMLPCLSLLLGPSRCSHPTCHRWMLCP